MAGKPSVVGEYDSRRVQTRVHPLCERRNKVGDVLGDDCPVLDLCPIEEVAIFHAEQLRRFGDGDDIMAPVDSPARVPNAPAGVRSRNGNCRTSTDRLRSDPSIRGDALRHRRRRRVPDLAVDAPHATLALPHDQVAEAT